MDLTGSVKKFARKLNDNQGVIASFALLVAIFSLFNFKIDIFSWPGIFMAFPPETKMWYLWIFNFLVTILIGLLLLNKINNFKNADETKTAQLLLSEIGQIENVLNTIPIANNDAEKVKYVGNEYRKGASVLIQNMPVYTVSAKEILSFNDDLRNDLTVFYGIINSLNDAHEKFLFDSGGAPDIFTIRVFFDNVNKAKELIQKIKESLKRI